jgi:hypothetical protein
MCFAGYRNRKNIPASVVDSFEHSGVGHVQSRPIQAPNNKNVQTSRFEQKRNSSRDGERQVFGDVDL